MKEFLLIALAGMALTFAAFSLGQRYQKEVTKNKITIEIETRGKVDEKINALDAVGLCASLGGRLSDDGQCQ